jgi:hypothetical protein
MASAPAPVVLRKSRRVRLVMAITPPTFQALAQVIGDAQRVRDDRVRRIHRPDGGHEGDVRDVQAGAGAAE